MTKKNKWRKQFKRAFLERNSDLLHQILIQASQSLGKDEAERILSNELIPNLTKEEQDWWLNQLSPHLQEEMGEKSKTATVKMLLDGGFEFGKDFSIVDGTIGLSNRAQKYLIHQIPEKHKEGFKSQFASMNQADPYLMLEKQLGTNFFDNLQKIAQTRLSSLDDLQAMGYITNIIEGIKTRHPELEDFPEWFISSVVGQDRWDRLTNLKESDWGNVSFVMPDLIKAAGGENEISPDGKGMSINGLKLLSQVWDGENHSLREFVATLPPSDRAQ
jgi:hypothetical protein